jgi:lycopene elongase/hydratase (dihydrobisanhydrobacterioruberin-forming)
MIRTLISISRPRFWVYLIGPYLIGLAGKGIDLRIDAVLIIGLLLFSFPANLLIYGVNDIADHDTDKFNQKKGTYENLLKVDMRKRIALYIGLLSILPLQIFALYALSIDSQYINTGLLLFGFFGVFYSLPPIRAKARPFLDSSFNILYIFPAFVSYGYLYNSFPPVIYIIAGALWCAAMHAFSAVPDIEADTKARLSTIATVLGKNGTISLCLVMYLAASFICGLSLLPVGVLGGVVYSGLMLKAFRSTSDEQLFAVYKLFPFINMLMGFILFWYILLHNS